MLYSLRQIRLLALLTLTLPTLFALATQSHAQDLPIPPSAERICTLIAEAQSGKILLEAGDCDTRVTPASTFKLPLAVMGFESGFLHSPDAPSLPFRQGDPDWGGAAWRQDTTPRHWLEYSVVWYSQRITRALGAPTLTRYAQAFGYGNADFSGDAGFDNGLERAWIASSLRVSPREQLGFLRGLVTGILPVSAHAMAATRASTQSTVQDGWQIWGKTGTAYPRKKDRSFDYAHGWGWYVGWAQPEGGQRTGTPQGEENTLVFVQLTRGTARTKGSPGNQTRAAVLAGWAQAMRVYQAPARR